MEAAISLLYGPLNLLRGTRYAAKEVSNLDFGKTVMTILDRLMGLDHDSLIANIVRCRASFN